MAKFSIKNNAGNSREFQTSRLVPAVRDKIVQFTISMLKEMSEDLIESFQMTDYTKKSVMDLIDDLALYLIEEKPGKLEQLLACIVCEVGTKESKKDITEYSEYFRENISMVQEMRILLDFFTQNSLAEIYIEFQFIKSRIMKLIAMEKKNLQAKVS